MTIQRFGVPMPFSRMKKLVFAGLLAASSVVAQAGMVTATLGDFSTGDDVWTRWPLTLDVGQFRFSNSGNIVSATLSGTFGNGFSNTSTEVFVYGDGLEVAYCSLYDDCSTNSEVAPPTAWSYAFTGADLALLRDGVLNLTVSKEFTGYVNLGSLSLALVNDVPEPASSALLLAGLAGLGWSRRTGRKRS